MSNWQKAVREAGPHMSLGAQIAGGLLIFLLLGYWADHLLGSGPWGILVGAALGMTAVIVRLMQVAKDQR